MKKSVQKVALVASMLAMSSTMRAAHETAAPRYAAPRRRNTFGLPPVKTNEVEKPVTVITRPAPGCTVQSVGLPMAKHGYKVVIYGQVQFGTAKAQLKAQNKWVMQAQRWFYHTPIEEIIAQNFVSSEVDEEFLAARMAEEKARKAAERKLNKAIRAQMAKMKSEG